MAASELIPLGLSSVRPFFVIISHDQLQIYSLYSTSLDPYEQLSTLSTILLEHSWWLQIALHFLSSLPPARFSRYSAGKSCQDSAWLVQEHLRWLAARLQNHLVDDGLQNDEQNSQQVLATNNYCYYYYYYIYIYKSHIPGLS